MKARAEELDSTSIRDAFIPRASTHFNSMGYETNNDDDSCDLRQHVVSPMAIWLVVDPRRFNSKASTPRHELCAMHKKQNVMMVVVLVTLRRHQSARRTFLPSSCLYAPIPDAALRGS